MRKGYNTQLDSYSAFVDSFGFEETGLADDLKAHDIKRVVCVGLAEDFCVFETALAAGRRNFDTLILQDGVRGIAPMSSAQLHSLASAGVRYVTLVDLPEMAFNDRA